MRKIFRITMLLAGISSQAYAQQSTETNSAFEVQTNPFHRKFIFDLGKGDKMQVEVYSLADLDYLQNVDSILNVFIADLEPLKDSLSREIYSRTIEYTIDAANLKRISMSRHAGPTSNFVISNNELSLLKVEQDTLIINGIVPGRSGRKLFQKEAEQHYFRLSLFLNDINELVMYKDHLSERIKKLTASAKNNWTLGKNGMMHLKSHPDIEAPASRGFIGGGDFISVRPSVDIQNYKNYFIPSVTGGLAVVTNKNLVHREYFLGYETHFLFRKNTAGKDETLLNNIIVVSYGQANINPYTKKTGSLYPFISLGYLVKRRGDIYDKNTFRLCLGQFNLFGNYTKIEPGCYFNNFFRNVTASLRITQHF